VHRNSAEPSTAAPMTAALESYTAPGRKIRWCNDFVAGGEDGAPRRRKTVHAGSAARRSSHRSRGM
jgi:hypothetical protein